MESLDELFREGVTAYQEERMQDAANIFTDALKIVPEDQRLLDSRAAAFTQLGTFKPALLDAKQMIVSSLAQGMKGPKAVKGYVRSAKIYRTMGRIENLRQAVQVLNIGLKKCESSTASQPLLKLLNEIQNELAELELRIRANYISALPAEMIVIIASYLTPPMIVRMSHVNREWRQIINSTPALWKHLTLRFLPSASESSSTASSRKVQFWSSRLSSGNNNCVHSLRIEAEVRELTDIHGCLAHLRHRGHLSGLSRAVIRSANVPLCPFWHEISWSPCIPTLERLYYGGATARDVTGDTIWSALKSFRKLKVLHYVGQSVPSSRHVFRPELKIGQLCNDSDSEPIQHEPTNISPLEEIRLVHCYEIVRIPQWGAFMCKDPVKTPFLRSAVFHGRAIVTGLPIVMDSPVLTSLELAGPVGLEGTTLMKLSTTANLLNITEMRLVDVGNLPEVLLSSFKVPLLRVFEFSDNKRPDGGIFPNFMATLSETSPNVARLTIRHNASIELSDLAKALANWSGTLTWLDLGFSGVTNGTIEVISRASLKVSHLNLEYCPSITGGPIVRLVKDRLERAQKGEESVSTVRELLMEGCTGVQKEAEDWLRAQVPRFKYLFESKKDNRSSRVRLGPRW